MKKTPCLKIKSVKLFLYATFLSTRLFIAVGCGKEPANAKNFPNFIDMGTKTLADFDCTGSTFKYAYEAYDYLLYFDKENKAAGQEADYAKILADMTNSTILLVRDPGWANGPSGLVDDNEFDFVGGWGTLSAIGIEGLYNNGDMLHSTELRYIWVHTEEKKEDVQKLFENTTTKEERIKKLAAEGYTFGAIKSWSPDKYVLSIKDDAGNYVFSEAKGNIVDAQALGYRSPDKVLDAMIDGSLTNVDFIISMSKEKAPGMAGLSIETTDGKPGGPPALIAEFYTTLWTNNERTPQCMKNAMNVLTSSYIGASIELFWHLNKGLEKGSNPESFKGKVTWGQSISENYSDGHEWLKFNNATPISHPSLTGTYKENWEKFLQDRIDGVNNSN